MINKLRKILLTVITGIICAASGQAASNSILVLGFDCARMTSVEDTLLRETLMRHLLSAGIDIVPVMKIEGYLQENGALNIRKMSSRDIQRFCAETGAASAVTGTITPEAGSPRGNTIDDGVTYNCVIKIYSSEGEPVRDAGFSIKCRGGFEGFVKEFSKKAASVVKEQALPAHEKATD